MKLKREIDLLALVAFLLALPSSILSVSGLLSRPKILIFPPRQILLYANPQGDSAALLRTAAQVSLVNDGDSHHRALVTGVSLELRVGDETVHQVWQSYGFSRGGEQRQLIVEEKEEVQILVLAGGSALSREVFFASSTSETGGQENFIGWSKFIESLKAARGKKLRVELAVHQLGRRDESVRCEIKVDEDLLFHLQKGWSAPACLARGGEG